MNKRREIYISSYPKSGSTWLTRLLADVLNCPSGGSTPEQDEKEIATEGYDRPGKYIVRKGHFRLVDNNIEAGRFRTVDNKIVPEPHRLNWQNVTNELLVFLYRDPRDICVSGAWHWRTTPQAFLDRMIKGDIARCGRWDYYCQQHLENKCTIVEVSYEELLKDTFNELKSIIEYLGVEMPYDNWIKQAIERQSFKIKSAGMTEQEMRKNNMRKGITGDWRNHFTPAMNNKIWLEFGWMMERLGYSK